MSEELKQGCVVFMNESSGLTGWGNAQCVSSVMVPLGEIGLYGHNQIYSMSDIDKIVSYPCEELIAKLQKQSDLLTLGLLQEKRKVTALLEALEMFIALDGNKEGIEHSSCRSVDCDLCKAFIRAKQVIAEAK